MEYRSKHPMDVLRWIEKVIDSCETYQQTRVADKLLHHYKKIYVLYDLTTPLYHEWNKINWELGRKQNELLGK